MDFRGSNMKGVRKTAESVTLLPSVPLVRRVENLAMFYMVLANLVKLSVEVFIWASLVAQLVRNLPAMQETPVQLLGH